MIDAKLLLDRFLGASGARPGHGPLGGNTPGGHSPGGGAFGGALGGSLGGGVLGQVLGQLAARQGGARAPGSPSPGLSIPGLGGSGAGGSGMSGFPGGAAVGGLLGMLLGGGKKQRGGLGGLLSHGGAAALGALAFRAWQNWQQGHAPGAAPPVTPADESAAQRFLPSTAPATDGQPFELALIRAMIGAAKADGHIDETEQRAIFGQVEQAGLDAEAKALVFDALSQPADPVAIAAMARGQEQAAELYLASRLAIDPDQPAEQAYLETLAQRLGLPAELTQHLSAQAEVAMRETAG